MVGWIIFGVLFLAFAIWWELHPVKLSEKGQKLLASLKEDKHYHDDCE